METSEKFNPIIEQLSRIDKMAAEKAARAEEQKDALLDSFEDKKEQYTARLKAESDERLAALKASLDEEANEKLAEVRAEYERRLRSLDEQYAQNAQIWAEEIFNAVIGG